MNSRSLTFFLASWIILDTSYVHSFNVHFSTPTSTAFRPSLSPKGIKMSTQSEQIQAVSDNTSETNIITTAPKKGRKLRANPKTFEFNQNLQALVRNKNVLRAHELLLECNEPGVGDTYGYTQVIIAWSRYGRNNQSSSREQQSINPAQKAHELLTLMHERQIPANTITYNSVLSAYARSSSRVNDLPEIFSLLDTMNQYSLADTISYNTLLNALATRNQSDKAVELLTKLLSGETEIKANVVTFSTVINALAKKASVTQNVAYAKQATKVLQQLEQYHQSSGCDASTAPNTQCVNTVLNAWCKVGAADQCCRILSRMERLSDEGRSEMTPTAVSYNTVLVALSNSGGVHTIKQTQGLFDRMKARGIEHDERSYNSLILSFVNHGNPKSAEAILEEMKDNGTIKPTTIHYSSVINAYARKGRALDAERVLKQLEAGGSQCNPNTIIYNSVIHAHAKSGVENAGAYATALLGRMIALYRTEGHPSMKPDVYSYTTTLSALSKSSPHLVTKGGSNGETAEKLLLVMERLFDEHPHDLDLQPNQRTYTAAISTLSRCPDQDAPLRAEAILDRMIARYAKTAATNDNENEATQQNHAPDNVCFNAVLNAWAHSSSVHHPDHAVQAQRVLHKMEEYAKDHPNANCTPDWLSYHTVLNACAFTINQELNSSQDTTAQATVTSRHRGEALKIAVTTLEIFQSLEGSTKPDSSTYGLMLNVITNLCSAPEQHELRSKLTENTFQQCCRDGLVSNNVVSKLRYACGIGKDDNDSEGLFRRLLLLDNKDDSGSDTSSRYKMIRVAMEQLPDKWTRNAMRSNQRKR